MTRIADPSAPIQSSPPRTSDFQRNQVDFLDHAARAAEIEALYDVPARLLRNDEGWTRELVSLGTHKSTHVVAPYHYNSTIAGSPAVTVDELPIDRFYGPGVVLEFRDRADGEAIDVADVTDALAVAGHELSAGDIVLMRTGRDQFYGQAGYIDRGPGGTAAATRMMHGAGVRAMGIDAYGWSCLLRMQAEEALARDEPGIF